MPSTPVSRLITTALVFALVACSRSDRGYRPLDPGAGDGAGGANGPAANPGGGGAPGPTAPPTPTVPIEPQWCHPASLADTASMDGNDSDSGSVAAAANGDALIAVEYGSRLFLSERSNGTWNHPVRLVTQPHNPAGGSMFTPRSALAANGDAVVVWVQRDNGTDRVYAASRAGGVWTDPANHADHLSPLGSNALNARVVVDPLGDAIAVWEQYVAGHGRIFKATLQNGTWTRPASENDGISPGAIHAQDVHVAVGPDGHVVVVWSQWGTTGYSIFKSERINGIWTNPASLADFFSPPGSHAYRPRVAFGGLGEAVVAWIQGDGSNDQVFKSEYRAGVWQHPVGLADNVSPDGTNATDVDVACAPNRQAVIVWRQQDGNGGTVLYKSEYRNAAWSHPGGPADAFGVGLQVNEFAVAMTSTGDVVVPFTAADASLVWSTYLSERRGGTWAHPASLAARISPAATAVTQPAIAIDGQDRVTVIWRQSDGVFQKTYISEYR